MQNGLVTNTWAQTAWTRRVVCWLVVVGALSACQTTEPKRLQLTDVPVKKTSFEIPDDMAKDAQAQVHEIGSKRIEQLVFKNGHIRYSRFYRGGYRETNRDKVLTEALYMYDRGKTPYTMGEAKTADLWNGLHHVTISFAAEDSCTVFMGDYGSRVELRGGPGHTGMITGTFCYGANAAQTERYTLEDLGQIVIYP